MEDQTIRSAQRMNDRRVPEVAAMLRAVRRAICVQ